MHAIAFAEVPLQIWWSRRDEMVVDQHRHSGLVYREIEQLNPDAPVSEVVGGWQHGGSMRWNTRLPEALHLIERREREVYHETDDIRIDFVKQSFRQFVALCERKEAETGEPVLIRASY